MVCKAKPTAGSQPWCTVSIAFVQRLVDEQPRAADRMRLKPVRESRTWCCRPRQRSDRLSIAGGQQLKLAIDLAGRYRIENNFDATLGSICKRIDTVPNDGKNAAPGPPVHGDDLIVVTTHLAYGRTAHHDRIFAGADSLEHAKPVLVDINTCAGGTKAIRVFVRVRSTALCHRAQRAPGKSGADDFHMSLRHAAAML
jgi:hypothetical protein